MTVYVDTSALVKLVVEEAESMALRRWLDAREGDVLVSSAIARTELLRVIRRGAPSLADLARDALGAINLVAVTRNLLEDAAVLDPPGLRTLDAVHLATARRFAADLDALVGYDGRLLEGARTLGLPVASPA